jgi:hypothetical protein
MRLESTPIIATPLLSWLLFTAFLALPIPVESQFDSSRSCIAEGTTIYSPGDARVKGPKFQSELAWVERPPKVSSRVVFEVLVNSAGRICDVHIIKAPDRETALRVGHYVGDHLRFTPASLKGKPVAARLKLVLDEHGTVRVER